MPPAPASQPPALGVWPALLVGQLVVNLPVVALFFGIYTLFQALLPASGWAHWLSLIVGFVASWAWWAYSVPRWRRWALRRGAPAVQLRRLSGLTLLTWPRGPLPDEAKKPSKR